MLDRYIDFLLAVLLTAVVLVMAGLSVALIVHLFQSGGCL